MIEDFYFYLNSGMSAQQAAEQIGARIDGKFLVVDASSEDVSVEYKVDISSLNK